MRSDSRPPAARSGAPYGLCAAWQIGDRERVGGVVGPGGSTGSPAGRRPCAGPGPWRRRRCRRRPASPPGACSRSRGCRAAAAASSDHAARLADRDRGAHVLAEVDAPPARPLPARASSISSHTRCVDAGQPAVRAAARRGPRSRRRRPRHRSPGDAHDAETGIRHARVDAHDDHHRGTDSAPRARMPPPARSRGPAPLFEHVRPGMSKFACTASTSSWSSRRLDQLAAARRASPSSTSTSVSSAPSPARRTRSRPRPPRARSRTAARSAGAAGPRAGRRRRRDVLGAGVDRGASGRPRRSGSPSTTTTPRFSNIQATEPGSPRLPPCLVEGVADLGAGAVAVVGQRLDQDRRRRRGRSPRRGRARSSSPSAPSPVPSVDRPLDVVLGHRVRRAPSGSPAASVEFAVRVAAALARRDRDRPRELREQLAPLGVGRRAFLCLIDAHLE